MKLNKKGFTLIELMVVIAIIAILATVVLVSLASARDAAEDANRSSALAQFRSLAEITYAQSEDLNYADVLEGNVSGLSEIVRQYGAAKDYTPTPSFVGATEPVLRFSISADREEYCAAIALKSEPKKFYCVDHNLAIKSIDRTGVTGTVTNPCIVDDTATPPGGPTPMGCPST